MPHLLNAVIQRLPLATTVWELPNDTSSSRELVLLWANNKALDGTDLRQYVGASIGDIPLPLLGASNLADEVAEAARGGQPDIISVSLRGRVYRTYITWVRPRTASVMLEDATEEYLAYQKLARSEQHLRLALDAAKAGVWRWEFATDALVWDPQMMEMFDADPETFSGKIDEFWKHVHSDDHEVIRDAIELAKKSEDHPYRVTYRTNGGRFIAARGEIVYRKGEAHHFLGVCMDITNQMTVDSRLARQAEDLKRSNEDLESFAYVASHDLQEPLRMIINFAKILEEDYGDVFSTEGRQYLDFMVGGASRMRAMIRGLLAFSRVGREETFQWALASEAIDGALANLDTFLEERNAKVHMGPMPAVFSDQMMLTLLFQNLIGNAIKFRSKDQDPEVFINCVDTGDNWTITVQDNGEGFDMAYADKVFMIFQRLSSTKRGTGIGLAICKKIVERHGGTIRVDSVPNVGTTFTFTLMKPEGPPRDFDSPQTTTDTTC